MIYSEKRDKHAVQVDNFGTTKGFAVERDLTLEQLAETTGLSRSALGKYETDDFKNISPFSIVTLAQFYGVSTAQIADAGSIQCKLDTACFLVSNPA